MYIILILIALLFSRIFLKIWSARRIETVTIFVKDNLYKKYENYNSIISITYFQIRGKPPDLSNSSHLFYEGDAYAR